MRATHLLLCLGVFNFVLTARADDAPAAAPAMQMVLDLADGSRVVGTPVIDRLKITTPYASLEIPLPEVIAVEFNADTDHTARVTLQDGDLLNGKLPAGIISLKTVFGDVVIQMALVKKIKVTPAGRGKPLPEGLVLHYTFDANGGEQVADASDAGSDGTVQGATYVNGGKIGGAMSFNGDHQAIVIKNAASLQLQDFTIMAWIKCAAKDKATDSGTDGMGMVFGCGGPGGYAFGLDKDGTLLLGKTGGDHVSSKFEIHDDVFHHVAVTKNGKKIVFYLDGAAYPAPDYEGNFQFTTGFPGGGGPELFGPIRRMNRQTGVAAVGAAPTNLDNSFWGVIDEVAVFKRPLSDAEVKGVYDSQK